MKDAIDIRSKDKTDDVDGASSYRNNIKEVQIWNNCEYSFDPDSSPKAWSHYKNFYDELKEDSARFSSEKRISMIFNHKNAEIRVAGDTSFNFGNKKFEIMRDIIDSDNTINEIKKENLKNILNECHEMHHTLLNFDLCPVTGGMNNVKGKLKYKYNKIVYHGIGRAPRLEMLDRFDTFICYLNESFEKINEFKASEKYDLKAYGDFFQNSIFTASINSENFGELYDFISVFTDIYEYCETMLLISDKEFVNIIIESGRQRIDSAISLEKYMTLAKKYWSLKEEYFITKRTE